MKQLRLIAGHFGKGTGASSIWMDEGEETIKLRDDIANYLKIKYNINSIKDENNKTLPGVINWLKSFIKSTDLIIEFHFNASSNYLATGCEVVIPDNYSLTEELVANKVNNTISKTLNIKERNIITATKTARGKIGMLELEGINILVEVCFLSNEKDIKAYKTNRNFLVQNLGDLIFILIKE